MNITVELTSPKQIFKSKIVGVTFNNEDGSSRQEIIERTKINSKIYLVRDYENEFDIFAIKVLNENKEQIGFLPSDNRMSNYLDSGNETKCLLFRKYGGKTFFDKLFSRKGKPLTCIIEISKEGMSEETSKKYTEFNEFDTKLNERLGKIYQEEKVNLDSSIENYKEIIELIKVSDEKGYFEKANRYVRIPINRLSLLLEKSKKYDLAIKYIEWYKNYNDYRGITKSETESIEKRYERILKKRTPNTVQN
tara:strand:+ start:787 stop:1536 length:750 start_codon:yes stop_codon:yes gene_type:complete